MIIDQKVLEDETLDPKNWEGIRSLGHEMLDNMLDYLASIRKSPVWQVMPDHIKQEFKRPVPIDPEGSSETYQDFKNLVLPYKLGNTHPRFWGWVLGTGNVMGMLADMLASGINSNLGGGDHAANYVERQVVDWFKDLFDFPTDASGLITSGGSVANLIGITVRGL